MIPSFDGTNTKENLEKIDFQRAVNGKLIVINHNLSSYELKQDSINILNTIHGFDELLKMFKINEGIKNDSLNEDGLNIKFEDTIKRCQSFCKQYSIKEFSDIDKYALFK